MKDEKMISNNIKSLLAGLALSACFTGVAVAAPLANFELEGSTDGGNTYQQSITVTPGETVNFEIVAYLSPVGTTNSNGKTITALANGKDGITSADFNISEASTTAIPISFSSDALATSFAQNATIASPGTISGSTITGIYPAANGVQSTVPTAAAPVLVLTGQFAVGNNVTAGSSTAITGIWDFGVGATGAFKINSPAQSVGVSDTTESSADPYLAYLSLTLNTAGSSTPEPASLGLLALGGVAMMRRRGRSITR